MGVLDMFREKVQPVGVPEEVYTPYQRFDNFMQQNIPPLAPSNIQAGMQVLSNTPPERVNQVVSEGVQYGLQSASANAGQRLQDPMAVMDFANMGMAGTFVGPKAVGFNEMRQFSNPWTRDLMSEISDRNAMINFEHFNATTPAPPPVEQAIRELSIPGLKQPLKIPTPGYRPIKTAPEQTFTLKNWDESRMDMGAVGRKLRSVTPEASQQDIYGTFMELMPRYKLPEVWHHPELYEKYPHLRDINVMYDPTLKAGDARYRGDINAIQMSGGTPDQIQSIFMHEGQHPIQRFEGHETGGSHNQFHPVDSALFSDHLSQAEAKMNMAFDAIEPEFGRLGIQRSTLKEALEKLYYNKKYGTKAPLETMTADHKAALNWFIRHPNADDLLEAVNPYLQAHGVDLDSKFAYQRLAGEWQARDNQTRKWLDDTERAELQPGSPVLAKIPRAGTPERATMDASGATDILEHGNKLISALHYNDFAIGVPGPKLIMNKGLKNTGVVTGKPK